MKKVALFTLVIILFGNLADAETMKGSSKGMEGLISSIIAFVMIIIVLYVLVLSYFLYYILNKSVRVKRKNPWFTCCAAIAVDVLFLILLKPINNIDIGFLFFIMSFGTIIGAGVGYFVSPMK